MTIYTVEEKVQIIKWHYAGYSSNEIIARFTDAFEKPAPLPPTVLSIVSKFEASGCVDTGGRCSHDDNSRIRKINKERISGENEACKVIEDNPCSSKQQPEEVTIKARRVEINLRKNGYRCNKPQFVPEISPGDKRKRLKFCEVMLKKVNKDENFLRNILFTGESCFTLDGRQTPTEIRYWAKETKQMNVTSDSSDSQNSHKVYVWAGILNDFVIGPIFIDGNLTGEKYLYYLKNNILPAIRALDINFDDIWLQQDGLPAHNTKSLKMFLKRTFAKRIIGIDGAICWPPRSADLAPSKFFVFGYIQQIIYRNNPLLNLEALHNKITNILHDITPEMLVDVRQEFYNRLEKCKAQQGGEFLHLC